MKKLATVLLATAAVAAHAQEFVDQARVRSAEPQYESVQVPREECSTHWVAEPRTVAAPPNYGGAVLGGVTGAVIGRQIGNGSGRDAATAVGAVVGAIAGDHLANRDRPAPLYAETQREVRSCQTVMETQRRLTGYRVQYEYRGHAYTTFTRDQPGATLPVRVSVLPVEPEYHRRH